MDEVDTPSSALPSYKAPVIVVYGAAIFTYPRKPYNVLGRCSMKGGEVLNSMRKVCPAVSVSLVALDTHTQSSTIIAHPHRRLMLHSS
jgi:hypothetical protein